MTTKAEFMRRAEAELGNYPAIASRYRVGDPLVTAMLHAMSNMLAAAAQDTAMHAAEPFVKATDATILADAAVKGVLPFGRSAKVAITVTNDGGSAFTLATGRKIVDSQGRIYAVDAGATIAAGTSATVQATQFTERTITHTVTVYQPFYPIEIPAAGDGSYIESVRVLDSSLTELEYRPEFVNTAPGELVYQLESDADRRLMIVFGAEGLAGYQPAAGEAITVVIRDCDGEVTLAPDSQFVFEYTLSPADGDVSLILDETLDGGAAPMPLSTIRQLATYPSIYNANAVYLGNFDFLVRRQMGGFRFLSVWNEQTEEQVRGANVDNINKLFVAAKMDGVDDADLFEQIKAIILTADNSYRVANVEVEEVEIPVEITAKVHSVYDFAQIQAQIVEQVLAEYGRDSSFAKAGQGRVLYRRIYSILTATIPALQGEKADLEVVVDDPPGVIPPEQYRYVSADSLTVTIEQA